ncbi:hypothetical protein QBC32DRAFT_352362 [Pseudoneurospora amorphoporcata]|uniref:Uncharacterized protein n=1 Tax=Pseudoneurospora amorphoporcata TaxID=241081 RepID=A0AAN6NLK8_9PEZI|nr:hypothetical protein QBC32DRAFT_352362 [Pseudoneurospora amorphoporcata]
MGLGLFSTSILEPSGQFSHARQIKDPESLGQISILAAKCLDLVPNTHSKSYTEPTHSRHHHKQTYQELETNTSLRSRHSRGSSDRRSGYGRIIATDGYEDGSQDRQSARPVRSHPSRTSRRPPSLERQDAFADTRTRKDCQIQRRDLVSSGRTLRVRHQLKGAGTHGLVIINGILMLQEEAMLPRRLDVRATQSLGKRRRGGLPECDAKRRKRGSVRNCGSLEQPSVFSSTCDAAGNSN